MKVFNTSLHMAREETELRVNLFGGFGNKLFQLAAALGAAKKMDCSVNVINTGYRSGYREKMQIPNSYLQIKDESINFVRKVRPRSISKFSEFNHFGVDYRPIPEADRKLILNGYFQSLGYFDQISEILLKFYLELILNSSDVSDIPILAIHVRLGDYLTETNQLIHGVMSEEYFLDAIQSMNIDSETRIVFLTDDEFSLRQYFPSLMKMGEVIPGNASEHFRMILRSNYKIISNSTFGWWAAWLGNGKVVAPKNWYANPHLMEELPLDFFPVDWNVI